MSAKERPPLWRRAFALPASSRRAIERELRFHLEMIVEDLVAQGLPRGEAEAEARRRFGDPEAAARECFTIDQRRYRRRGRMDHMWTLVDDLRQAARAVRKSPMLTVIVSVTLMLGLGATTAMFSLVDQVLLRPLPYSSPDHLVAIRDGAESDNPLSFPEYLALKSAGTATFSDVGAWYATTLTLTNAGEPQVLKGARLSASIPRMLGVRPVLGRVFDDADDVPGGERVLMLSEDCWSRVFGRDPHIVGRVLTLEGVPFTVVGVFPSSAAAMLPDDLRSGRRSDYWQALRLTEKSAPASLHFLSVVGRTRAPVTPALQSELTQDIAPRFHALSGPTHAPASKPLADEVLGSTRGLLALFLGAVSLVLLIACANVAGLLLARAAARQRELAVRAAIGASRSRIALQLLTESVLRALIGGALGVALAYGIIAVLRRTSAVQLPRLAEVHVDPAVLGFAVLLAVLTGLLCGAIPALRASQINLTDALREGGRGTVGSLGRDRFRRALVIVEVALSFTLLTGAGLLLQSFRHLLDVPTGFNPDRVITAEVSLPYTRYPDSTHVVAAYAEMLTAIRAIPGVQAAAFTSALPVEGGTNGGVGIEGRSFPPDAQPGAQKRIVSAGYFEAIGATLAAGRYFEATDVTGAPPVAVVNAAFVKRWLDDRYAVGRRVDFNWDTQGLQTIVGVVADIREGPLDQPAEPAIYVPVSQRPTSSMYLVVRSTGAPGSLVQALRHALLSVDPLLPLSNVRLARDIVTSSASTQRLGTWLLAAFSLVAVTLAAVGLYGVVSYSVVQRTSEFGVRAALGATRGRIMALVLRQGLALLGFGFVLGAIGGRSGATLLTAQLFGVTPGSPVLYLSVAATLVVVTLLAMIVPAMRAGRVDPLTALRAE
jgi:putative ABC transport system permease protein